MAHEFLTSYLNDHFAGSQMALGILDLLRGLDDDSTCGRESPTKYKRTVRNSSD